MPEVYKGPHSAVFVPALGRVVKRGEAVTVSDNRVRAALRRQGWKSVKEESDGGANK